MRQVFGLNELLGGCSGNLTIKVLTGLLLEDLKNSHCLIIGETADDESVVLANMPIIADTLYYEMFDQRIEFVVAGPILVSNYPALTYRVKGECFGFYGRCSTIPKVCGVDLYLSRSYTEVIGDVARQKFSVSVTKLFKKLK